jgi:hypothetical protein
VHVGRNLFSVAMAILHGTGARCEALTPVDWSEAMEMRQTSLRCLVEKWMGPSAQARVTRFNPCAVYPWRYVRAELTGPSGDLAIVFFLHDDGSWCVFPPERKRPAMTVARMPTALGLGIGVEAQQVA